MYTSLLIKTHKAMEQTWDNGGTSHVLPEERKRATKFFRKSFLDQRPSLDKLAGTASLLRNTGAASLLSPLSQTLSRTSTPR